MRGTTLRSSLVLVIAAGAACSRDVPPTVPSSALGPVPQVTAPRPPPTAAIQPAEIVPMLEPAGTPSDPADGPRVDPAVARTGDREVTELVDPGASEPQPVREVVAVIAPTQGSKVRGTVRLRDSGDGGLDVHATINGLPRGLHAYHVHVFGDCSSPDAMSAGGHFHFEGSSMDKDVPMITGDLGELRGAGKRTVHESRIAGASLQGKFSVVGRAIVIHEKPNDPAVTPDGGAGKRIACGVIGVANPAP